MLKTALGACEGSLSLTTEDSTQTISKSDPTRAIHEKKKINKIKKNKKKSNPCTRLIRNMDSRTGKTAQLLMVFDVQAW